MMEAERAGLAMAGAKTHVRVSSGRTEAAPERQVPNLHASLPSCCHVGSAATAHAVNFT